MISLEAFPCEIQLEILGYLDPIALVQLIKTSQQFNALAKEKNLWNQFFSETEKQREIYSLKGADLFLANWDHLKKKYSAFHPANSILKSLLLTTEQMSTEKSKAEHLFFKLFKEKKKHEEHGTEAVILYSGMLNKLMLVYFWESWCGSISQVLSSNSRLVHWVLNNPDILEVLSKKASAFQIYSLIKHNEEAACLVFQDQEFEPLKKKLLANEGHKDYTKGEYWAHTLACRYPEFAKRAFKEATFM